MQAQRASSNDSAIGATRADHVTAIMRCGLAASGLLALLIDAFDPTELTEASIISFCFYMIYSTVLYFKIRHPDRHLPIIQSWSHWMDIAWFTVLIFLGQCTYSVFFFGFLFAIMIASFRQGFTSGMRITLVSAVIYTLASFVDNTDTWLLILHNPKPDLDTFLVHPLFLLVLGMMMAFWGGLELTLQRRLALLKEVVTFSNPRFGVDRMIGRVMECVRAFYNADACLLVSLDLSQKAYYLRYADGNDQARAMTRNPIPHAFGNLLLGFSLTYSAVFPCRNRWWDRRADDRISIAGTAETSAIPEPISQQIAATLDARSFMTVPFSYHNEMPSRLYLIAKRHVFQASDTDFLLQVIGHVLPMLDNLRLVDRLASEAAEDERRRISRDLHDSIIQPYIGLHIGLGGLRQRFANGSTIVADDVDQLLQLTETGIGELRDYVYRLATPDEREGSLSYSLHRFAAKFADATHITVEMQVVPNLDINDRLAAEIFQIAVEGLSNIRRHTVSPYAAVRLSNSANHLIMQIENAGSDIFVPFVPRSITERARSLGGVTHVEQDMCKKTIVSVSIPL